MADLGPGSCVGLVEHLAAAATAAAAAAANPGAIAGGGGAQMSGLTSTGAGEGPAVRWGATYAAAGGEAVVLLSAPAARVREVLHQVPAAQFCAHTIASLKFIRAAMVDNSGGRRPAEG